MEKYTLQIQFDNVEALKHFAQWLDGQGEQDYWVWMECREQEEKGEITALKFKYQVNSQATDGNYIFTKCGRLDNKRK